MGAPAVVRRIFKPKPAPAPVPTPPTPTAPMVSQSQSADAYDARKTKARGRSMTILTNSRGVGKNMSSVLGKKSLLGAV